MRMRGTVTDKDDLDIQVVALFVVETNAQLVALLTISQAEAL